MLKSEARASGLYAYDLTPSPDGLRHYRALKEEEEKGPGLKIEYSPQDCSGAFLVLPQYNKLTGSGGTKGEMTGESRGHYLISTPLSRKKHSPGHDQSAYKHHLMLSNESRAMSLANSFEKGHAREDIRLMRDALHHCTPENVGAFRVGPGIERSAGGFDPSLYLDLGNSDERRRRDDVRLSPGQEAEVGNDQRKEFSNLHAKQEAACDILQESVIRNPFKNITNTLKGVCDLRGGRELQNEDLMLLLPSTPMRAAEGEVKNKENI